MPAAMQPASVWRGAVLLLGLLSLSGPARADTWGQVEEVLSGVAAVYYAEPDPDAMLRGALVAMTEQAPRALFDGASHRERYRIRIGQQIVVSLEHPADIDDAIVGIVKVADVLHQRTRVSSQRLVEAALRGAVMALGNCYSVYLTADTVKRLSFARGEEPADVGVSLECGSHGQVRHVRPSSPAYLAGFEPGDKIRAVDGRPTRGLDAAEIYALLSGKQGTRVRVGLTRNSGVDVTVELVREVPVEHKAARHQIAGGRVLYLRPGPMGERTTAATVPFLGCATRQGIILDLRGNEGGRVDEAERFAGLFLEPGPIASIEGRGQRSLGQLETQSEGPCARVPVVVLVDRQTASAAELIAQALRERRHATLIGQATFGKGSVQQFLRFEDGSVAKVTTARYLSPSGKPLDRSLEPDIKMPDAGVHLREGSDPTIDPVVRLALDRLLLGGPGPRTVGK